MSSSNSLKLSCDTSPLLLFTKLLETVLKGSERSLSLCDLGFELFRVENDHDPARAGEVVVRLYPSDRFMMLAAAFLAEDFDLVVIE